MKQYSRGLEKETVFSEFIDITEEELEKVRQIEQDWKQRKYELSNDFGKDDDEYDRAYLQQEDNEFFPKHLEYDLNEYGYPSRVNCEDEEINPLELATEIRNIIFGDKEEEKNLIKCMKIRQNISERKRIVLN